MPRAGRLDDEIRAFLGAPDPTLDQERAEVARIRARRGEAGAWTEAREYPRQDPAPPPVLGPGGDFRVEFYDRGRPSVVEHADDYGAALRRTRDGLLGSSGDAARVYRGRDLVTTARLERAEVRGRGGRYVVRFAPSGERPRKRGR